MSESRLRSTSLSHSAAPGSSSDPNHAAPDVVSAPGVTRRAALAGMALAAVAAIPAVAALSGCGKTADTSQAPAMSASLDAPAMDAAGSGQDAFGDAPAMLGQVRLGTMPTEDFLPGWVADRDGLFSAAGAECTVTPFQSAQELIAAVSAGQIDMAMTDPMVSASLTVGGTPIVMQWVTLGATPDQGRFGIATSGDSGLTTIDDLRGATIGVGSNTLPEYVMDRLLEAAGIGVGDFTAEEIKKVPVRYQMMESGQVQAAALPGSLLALGEATGCVTLADDSSGDNLSQSVMAVRADFADQDGADRLIQAVRQAWDQAAQQINDDPESYRALLVENAGLSDAVADTYPISTYPTGVAPSAENIQPILDWMVQKGYLESPLTFDEQTLGFKAE